MLAHNLKEILSIVPEALPLVKKANLEEEFPLDSADSSAASYLRLSYLTKVAGKHVDGDQANLIEKAARLYGVKDQLDKYLGRFVSMEKKAEASFDPLRLTAKQAEINFESDLAGFGFLSIEKTASVASDIYETYGDEISSDKVLRYSGHAVLNKEAAVQSLSNRYAATKDAAFVKVAGLIVREVDATDFKTVSELCKTVTQLDKKAGLDIIGFDFYKEALVTKEAACSGSYFGVNVADEVFPYEKVEALGKGRIGAVLGKDIEDALTDSPINNKVVIESLPRDLQIILKSLLKAV